MLALLALIISQFGESLPPSREAEERALAVLLSQRSTWNQRSNAVDELERRKHRFSAQEVQRLKQALVAAPRGAPKTCRPNDCSREISDCLGQRGFIFAAVERTPSAHEFVELAYQTISQADDLPAIQFARGVLARVGDPRAEALGVALLKRHDWSCVGVAAGLLENLPEWDPRTATLVRESFAARDSNRYLLADLIAARSEPWAKELASTFLTSAESDLRRSGVYALSRRGRSANEVAQLAFIASCDVSQTLRRYAAMLIKESDTPTISCPTPAWSYARRTVTNGARKIPLASGTSLSAAGACDGLGVFAEACVVAENRGEWGGSLFLVRGSTRTLIVEDPFLQAAALLKWGDDTVVISSLAHMQGSGGIGRLVTVGDGGLRYEWLNQFHQLPVAWGVHGDTLVVAFRGDPMSGPCRDLPAEAEVAMVYQSDGGFAVARSAATTCLWP